MNVRVALVLTALLTADHSAAADELEGSLTLVGRDVRVTVRHADGRPAAGVPVRLVNGRLLNVAVARTDAAGRWGHADLAPGTYEAVIEPASPTEPTTRLPFLVRETVNIDPTTWAAAAVGLLCLGGAIVTGAARRPRPLSRGCAAGLLATGAILLAWAGWFRDTAPSIGGPDVAAAARTYLEQRDVRPLSGPLERLLAEPGAVVPTQPHPLLGKPAPNVTLTDHAGQPWRLRDQTGPVVLVFYLGYQCNHCVGQLFALHADVAKFRELGATVVAVSADPPDWTREQFRKYGPFDFPVLADPGNALARHYGAYGANPDDPLHGTFVLDAGGRVRWAQTGPEPFTDNRTLLVESARRRD